MSTVETVLKAAAETPGAEILASIKKTANFVARLGVGFEKKLRETEKNNPKFSFLNGNDKFNKLYLDLINANRKDEAIKSGTAEVIERENERRELSAKAGALILQEKQELNYSNVFGTQNLNDKGVIKPTVFTQEEIVERSKRAPPTLVQRILRAQKKLSDAAWNPAIVQGYVPNQFTLEYPENYVLEAQDLDTIKLTAHFVAKNGHQYQVGLTQREANNPRFDFLRTGHPFYPLFSRLVESYTKVLLPPKNIQTMLETNFGDKQALLDQIILSHELQRKKDEEKHAELEKRERDRKAIQAIDWNDFVVVETIDFAPKKEVAPPAPPASQPTSTPSSTPSSTSSSTSSSTPSTKSGTPTTSGASATSSTPTPAAPGPRIVKDFTRPKAPNLKTQLCPKCGDPISVNELDAHIKKCIGTKAPAAQPEDTKPVVAAPEAEMGALLSTFAEHRSDIFDIEKKSEKKKPKKEAPPALEQTEKVPPPVPTPPAVAHPINLAAKFQPPTKLPFPPANFAPKPTLAMHKGLLTRSPNLTLNNTQPSLSSSSMGPVSSSSAQISNQNMQVKKQKMENQDEPDNYITVQVQLPEEAAQEKDFNFQENVISLPCYLSDTFKSIKEKLKNATNVPLGRQILSGFGQKVLANTQTLANFTKVEEGSVTITLSVKKK